MFADIEVNMYVSVCEHVFFRFIAPFGGAVSLWFLPASNEAPFWPLVSEIKNLKYR